MRYIIRSSILGFVALLLQWLLIGRLQLWGTYADLTLLIIAWTALKHGRLGGSIAGFMIGYGLDILYGTWGLQAFVKTIVGFMVGYFVAEEQLRLLYQPHRTLIGALTIALVHFGLIAFVLVIQTGTRTPELVQMMLGCSILTALLGVILSLFRTRSRD